MQALGDADSSVRAMAAQALGKIGDGRAVEPLCKALGDADKSVYINAARALWKNCDPRAVQPLRKAREHPDLDLQRIAVLALAVLGNIDDAGAVELLCESLEYTDEAADAAKALVKVGGPAVAPLRKKLSWIENTSETNVEALCKKVVYYRDERLAYIWRD